MMNDELTLIKYETRENDMGDVINDKVKTKVLCSVESVTRSEFYAGASHDLQPEIVFVINKYDYENQSEVEFEGRKYNVIRSYLPKGRHNPNPMDIDRLELVCKGAD